MSYNLLETFDFILFGNPVSAIARVDIESEINAPASSSDSKLLSQAWLLMLESQIGKVDKKIQDLTIDTLRGQTLVYFHYGILPPQKERTTDMHQLATLSIELCEKGKLFVLAHPREFDRRQSAEALAGLIMVNSLATVCSIIESGMRADTLYALIYGLHKWETEGRPGVMTAFAKTWDFNAIDKIIVRGKQLVHLKMTKPY